LLAFNASKYYYDKSQKFKVNGIWRFDLFVNAWLVEHGYARVMTYPPNVKYADLFLKLEQKARESDKGLWSVSRKGKIETGQGYWGSSKSDKFHKPGCRWAQKISPQNPIVFKKRAEAG
jgi:micrococcal nuclease